MTKKRKHFKVNNSIVHAFTIDLLLPRTIDHSSANVDLLCVHPTGVTVYKEVLYLTDKLP